MKRVLLTGASGFIGSHVLSHFLEHTDWDVVCVCSFRHKGHPERITGNANYQANPGRVIIATADLTGVIPDYGQFDYIVHLASESHVDRSISDPVPFVENNVSMMLQILEYARRYPPTKFLSFGTDEVYGSVPDGHTADEWDVLVPSNPYAASKAAQEALSIAWFRTYNVPVIMTNTNNAIGAGQDPEKFVPKIIKAISEGREIEIHVNGGKQGTRHYNPVTNIADALRFILTNTDPAPAGSPRPARYSIGGGKQLTNLALAEAVATAMGKEMRWRMVDVSGLRPGYDQHYANAGESLTAAGWTPPSTFEQELERIVAACT